MQTGSKDYLMQLKSDASANIIQEPGYFAAKEPFWVIKGDIKIGYLHFGGLKNSVQKYVFVNNFLNNFEELSIFFFSQKQLKG